MTDASFALVVTSIDPENEQSEDGHKYPYMELEHDGCRWYTRPWGWVLHVEPPTAKYWCYSRGWATTRAAAQRKARRKLNEWHRKEARKGKEYIEL